MTQASLRRVVVAILLISTVALAGCTGGDSASEAGESTSPKMEKVSSSGNLDVYEDTTAITKVKYDGGMAKFIYWEDETVCTRWESAQEGGVGCLPFNETRVDERYSR